MKRSAALAAIVAAALGSACTDQSPLGVQPVDPKPFLDIRDGNNGGPSSQFFFLPPIRPLSLRPPSSGFNAGLRPVVEIYECTLRDAKGCSDVMGALVSTLTMDDPSAIDRLYVLPHLKQYAAIWRAYRVPNLTAAKFYRIQVKVGGTLLGYADVDIVRTLSQLLQVKRENFVPTFENFVLPITFWIGGGALCEPSTSACSSETVQFGSAAPAATVELQAGGEVFRLDIDAGTEATSGGRPVSEVTFNLELCDDPIDVDLPKFGQCLRVTALFGTTGTAELVFDNNAARVSMCSFSVAPPESQEQLVTLHQQDGDLIRALPHVDPNCDAPEPGAPSQLGDAGGHRLGRLILVGWRRVRDGVAALVAPRQLFARSRVALLDLGGGGQTHRLGLPPCTSGSPPVAGLALATCIAAVAPQLVTPDPTNGHTVSDFQFALPAKMDYFDSEDADRTAPANTPIVFQVSVTDARQVAITGGSVTFTITEGEATDIVTAPVVEGIAQITRTLAEGTTTVVASGVGIASADINGPLTFDPDGEGPRSAFDPFWPDFTVPSIAGTTVSVGTGEVSFTATGIPVVRVAVNDFTIDLRAGLIRNASPVSGGGFFKGTQVIFGAGFAYATSATDILVGFSTRNSDSDFDPTAPVVVVSVGSSETPHHTTAEVRPGADLTGISGVTVTQESFAFSNTADAGYVLLKYTLTNTNAGDVTDVFAGFVVDPDLLFFGTHADDLAAFNDVLFVAEVTESNETQTQVIGIVPITSMEADLNYSGYVSGVADPTTSAGYFPLLSAGLPDGSGSVGPADVRFVTGFGPFSIPAEETRVVWFALVGGLDRPAFEANVGAARAKVQAGGF